MKKKNDSLSNVRFSCVHVCMEALEKLYPGVIKALGKETEEGFYCDFAPPEGVKISENDFHRIEEEMRSIIRKKVPLIRKELSFSEARNLFLQNPYKQEEIDACEKRGEKPAIYMTGDEEGSFYDLEMHPLVESTDEIKVFKLLSVAGAYWKGNSKNAMLVRIYGAAFHSQEELDQFLCSKEEARRRDHRKIGKELGLFMLSPDAIGQGLPLWLNKGVIIRDEIEAWAKQTEAQYGYQRVITPILGKEALYKVSGHLAYYRDDMYAPISIEDERYYLRPMNCPHHHQVYKNEKRSYRDLPFRIAEYGNVFRFEASGALSGLMRTRGFCQNDGHIYCREDQVEKEFANVLEMFRYYYTVLGIHDYYMRLSKPDLAKKSKYINDPSQWEKAIDMVRSAMKRVGFPYLEVEGEAAFYGPKIDFQIKSALGTEFTISTNQLDFLASERFDLRYVGEDGNLHPLYVIHRAPLGSHERLIAYLIEHFEGAFPVWLSPVQASIIPVADRHIEYCTNIHKMFVKNGIRAEVQAESGTMNSKIRYAQEQKVPYAVVIGDKEMNSGLLSVRDRKGEQRHGLQIDAFVQTVNEIIKSKSLKLWG